jgi:PAS domain S-box-containing protein
MGEFDNDSGASEAPFVRAAPRRDPQRFDLLIDSVVDYAIFMLDPDGVILTWNAGAQRLKGYRAEEIIGRSFKAFYAPEAVQAGWPDQELRTAAAEGRFEDEGWRVRKDGSRFWANVVITRLQSEDGSLQGFAKVTRDLTERRQQEEAVRRSEEQFRLLLESVQDYAIFMLTPQGHVLTWNSGAQAILGYRADEVVGRHFSVFFTPEDSKSDAPAGELRAALANNRAEMEGWRVRKDGSVFWAKAVLTPVRDAEGRLHGFAKVTRDLSEQRRLTELEHASERVGVFLAMLGHELRNPLAPIRNAVSVMQRTPDLPPMVERIREILDRQLGQMTRLVDDLLDVGRVATGKIVLRPALIDYRNVALLSVEGARPLLEARKHRIELDLPERPVLLKGDSARLTQALQNLLNNAAKYTNEGGHIRLAVSIDGRTCTTTVSDNGHGIGAEQLERVFTLFFQQELSSSNEGGLGIGLSLSRALVEAHGGRLFAHSAGPGQGSTFTLTLPLLYPKAGLDPGAEGDSDVRIESRRVLVVDDNADSADTMVAVLKTLDQDARAAYGVREAIEVAREFDPQVALVDLNLPDGDGFSLATRLRTQSRHRCLYIAAMTGYGQDADRRKTSEAGFDAHLTKPVGVKELQDVLRQASLQTG